MASQYLCTRIILQSMWAIPPCPNSLKFHGLRPTNLENPTCGEKSFPWREAHRAKWTDNKKKRAKRWGYRYRIPFRQRPRICSPKISREKKIGDIDSRRKETKISKRQKRETVQWRKGCFSPDQRTVYPQNAAGFGGAAGFNDVPKLASTSGEAISQFEGVEFYFKQATKSRKQE